MTERRSRDYLHGYTTDEQDRLIRQARQLEEAIHDHLPFRRARSLIEVGCGVGAQTAILLRYFPDLHITGIDRSPENLARAQRHLDSLPWTEGRFSLQQAEADTLPFDAGRFDAAFLCWILEHVGDPMRVLSETRRVLRSGAPVICNEVMNASFFIDPYSPNTLDFWRALNDHQLAIGGDPFVGAKLGNLLQAVGLRDVSTVVKTFHLDNRAPGERAEFLAYWTELLRSAAAGLVEAKLTTQEIAAAMERELASVGRDPNAVFFYSFIQARARVW